MKANVTFLAHVSDSKAAAEVPKIKYTFMSPPPPLAPSQNTGEPLSPRPLAQAANPQPQRTPTDMLSTGPGHQITTVQPATVQVSQPPPAGSYIAIAGAQAGQYTLV